MFKFDPTITLGSIVTLISALLTIGAAWMSITNRLTAIETRLQPIWDWWNRDGTSGERNLIDDKIEHAVRGAVATAVTQVLAQDRAHRKSER